MDGAVLRHLKLGLAARIRQLDERQCPTIATELKPLLLGGIGQTYILQRRLSFPFGKLFLPGCCRFLSLLPTMQPKASASPDQQRRPDVDRAQFGQTERSEVGRDQPPQDGTPCRH
ncbi:MAG: hypothetical protein KA182_15090 [Propionivibrio sp.]|nr:hypothetical protein [Propionivibrio sp.]